MQIKIKLGTWRGFYVHVYFNKHQHEQFYSKVQADVLKREEHLFKKVPQKLFELILLYDLKRSNILDQWPYWQFSYLVCVINKNWVKIISTSGELRYSVKTGVNGIFIVCIISFFSILGTLTIWISAGRRICIQNGTNHSERKC